MWDYKSFISYLLLDIDDPVNIVPIALILLCFIWSGVPQGKERWNAWWALFNGCIIHCWMDGIIGIYGRGPRWMVVEYGKLDLRYWKTKDATVMVICFAELLLMGPLCIVWYNSILKHAWYRHFLAIIISSFQMFGSIIYAFSEVWLGFKDLPLDSWPPSFKSWNDVFYFWIVFVLGNVVWTAIPTWFILKSVFVFCPKTEVQKKQK